MLINAKTARENVLKSKEVTDSKFEKVLSEINSYIERASVLGYNMTEIKLQILGLSETQINLMYIEFISKGYKVDIVDSDSWNIYW